MNVTDVPAALSLTGLDWGELILLLSPLPLIVVANWSERPPELLVNAVRRAAAGLGAPQEAGASSERHLVGPLQVGRALRQTTWFVLALIAAGCTVVGLLALAGVPAAGDGGGRLASYGAVLVVTGVVAILLLARPLRGRLANLLPVDPHSILDATALVLTVVVVGSQLASQFIVDLLSQQALSPLDLISQELPFLLAALVGVGIFVRRRPRQVLDRLGLVRVTPWQIVLALAAAGAFYAFGNGADALGHVLTPGVAQRVDAVNQRLFARLGDPLGIATIALSAGVCEEALFRGALQPRLGVLWTSLVFAAIHTQYGLSLDAAAVFLLAIGLGLLRRLANTTTTTVCHVTYNTLVGVGVGGTWLVPALAIEAGLLLAGAAAFLTGRLGSLRTAQ